MHSLNNVTDFGVINAFLPASSLLCGGLVGAFYLIGFSFHSYRRERELSKEERNKKEHSTAFLGGEGEGREYTINDRKVEPMSNTMYPWKMEVLDDRLLDVGCTVCR